MSRTFDETYAILRQIDNERRQAEMGMRLSLAKMERRQQFWRGVGLVAGGVLIMIANREGRH